MKNKKLVTVTQYAETHQLSRPTVYKLLEENKLTRYQAPDGSPALDPEERPIGVQRYSGIRDRKKK